jgi:hypothetical protein
MSVWRATVSGVTLRSRLVVLVSAPESTACSLTGCVRLRALALLAAGPQRQAVSALAGPAVWYSPRAAHASEEYCFAEAGSQSRTAFETLDRSAHQAYRL